MLHRLKQLDKLPTRDCHTVLVIYMRSGQSNLEDMLGTHCHTHMSHTHTYTHTQTYTSAYMLEDMLGTYTLTHTH